MIFNFPTQTEDILISDCEKIALCGCHQTTFSPLYQSHATTAKMEEVLGRMDYDKERRFYHILQTNRRCLMPSLPSPIARHRAQNRPFTWEEGNP